MAVSSMVHNLQDLGEEAEAGSPSGSGARHPEGGGSRMHWRLGGFQVSAVTALVECSCSSCYSTALTSEAEAESTQRERAGKVFWDQILGPQPWLGQKRCGSRCKES